jgi:hypothetical protein
MKALRRLARRLVRCRVRRALRRASQHDLDDELLRRHVRRVNERRPR